MSTTRIRGFSEAYGSWKIIWIASWMRRRSSGGKASTSLPRQKRWPALGAWSPAASRPSVDFPQPDSPTRPPPSTSPLPHREIDAVDRVHDLIADAGAEPLRDLRGGIERLHEPLGDAPQLE